ncbi:MAG: hypothetical protein LBQ69_07085 [Treponema sp.]|jgi:hypothetical protein|nr:hypothetical protein [Treponema sp.]
MTDTFFPFKKTGFLLLAAILATIFASCAGSPSAGSPSSRSVPLWVTDPARAYPDNEWLSVVEEEVDMRTAERAAVARLAQVFRVDLNVVTNANRQFAEAVDSVRGQTVSSDSREFAQELVSTSVVSGLIGLQVESWADRGGRAFANARMNRRECSARYSAMIRENEQVIGRLQEEAARHPETFEAFQMLNLAHSFALVTDNLHTLLTVLDPSTISRRPSYGNAEAVKSLAQSAGRAIIVTVNVNGDTGDRIAKAFTECLNSRGFRTNAGGANPYSLAASFSLEDVDLGNPRNKFVRYILTCSLRNRQGVEILSFSENQREGHLTESEARQRAIRTAEQSIGSTGFAVNFDAFLASLL